jgi:hypothetical protein
LVSNNKVINKNNSLIFERNIVSYEEYEKIKNISNNDELNPYWITGFVDGDGAFMIAISRKPTNIIGYSVRGIFQIALHEENKFILEKIKKFFNNVGRIEKIGPYYYYKVDNKRELLTVIIPHFEQFPLLTLNKSKSFFLFHSCINLTIKNKYLTLDVFKKILRFKICFKRGNKAKIFEKYPNIVPFNSNRIPKPLYTILNPYWISGFVDADGTFGVYKQKSSFRYTCSFRISQDKVDKKLLLDICKYFGAGSASETKRGMVNYGIFSIKDVNKVVIPFFKQYKLRTSKEIDFNYFVEIVNIINKKNLGIILTTEDHKEILLLTSKMNNARRKLFKPILNNIEKTESK